MGMQEVSNEFQFLRYSQSTNTLIPLHFLLLILQASDFEGSSRTVAPACILTIAYAAAALL